MIHHTHDTFRKARERRAPMGVIALIAAFGLTAAACGGSDDAASSTTDGTREVAPVATDAPVETEVSGTDAESATTSAPEDTSVESAPANTTSGEVAGTCSYSFVDGSPYQSCKVTSEEPSALPSTFAQGFESFTVEGTTTPAGGAQALVGGSDTAFVFAGTNLSDTARIIGATRGVGQFEGSTAHAFVLSPANSPDGRFTMDWFVGDDPQFEPGIDGESAIVDVVCVIGESTESCTYLGTDDRFVPAPDERTLVFIDPKGVTDPIDGVVAFTSAAETGAFRAGLVDANGLRRFTGLSDGTGEFDGVLLAEEGWGQVDGDTFTGSVRMSIIN